MNEKIIIGTAQFNAEYGINRQNLNPTNFKQKILKYSIQNDILYFDLSNKYCDYKNLKFDKNHKIILKIYFEEKENNLEKFIFKTIDIFKSNLKINSFYAILIHNFDDLEKEKLDKIFITLKSIKKKGIVHKIGISTYNFQNIIKNIKKYNFDILQCPFSIIDRRLIENNILKKIKKFDIEVHVRSIFLQGLIFKKSFNGYFKKWSTLFDRLNSYLKKKKLSKLEACIFFILNNPKVDKFIVGVENENQLDEIIKTVKSYEFHKFPKNLQSKNLKLINPSIWS